MKVISIFILASILFCAAGFSQDVVRLLINKNTAGEVKVNSNLNVIKVAQKKYGVVHNLAIEVIPAYIDRAGYKRYIEVTDENDAPIFDAKERPKEMKPGYYTLNIAKTRKAFEMYKTLKVYYLEEPEDKKTEVIKKLLVTVNIE